MRVQALSAILATATLGALVAGPAAAASPRDPSGTWLTGDGRARIKVERCGAKAAAICGTVVWLKSPLTDSGRPRTDAKNPDPAKRGRPVIGLLLMSELKPEDGKFRGEIYNSDEGRNYEVSVALKGANELGIEGCVLGFLCGSQTWTRVADPVQQSADAGSIQPAAGARAAARPAPVAKPAAEDDED